MLRAANKAVQPTGTNRLAQREIERHRWLAPVADLFIRRIVMSYNIAVVIPPVPCNDADAWRSVDALIKESGPRPSVFKKLHDQLTAKYPCICSVPDDRVDDTVWSDGPLINNFGHRAAVLGMSYSRVDEVLPFLVQTANNLGLIVFDWATETIHRAEQKH